MIFFVSWRKSCDVLHVKQTTLWHSLCHRDKNFQRDPFTWSQVIVLDWNEQQSNISCVTEKTMWYSLGEKNQQHGIPCVTVRQSCDILLVKKKQRGIPCGIEAIMWYSLCHRGNYVIFFVSQRQSCDILYVKETQWITEWFANSNADKYQIRKHGRPFRDRINDFSFNLTKS